MKGIGPAAYRCSRGLHPTRRTHVGDAGVCVDGSGWREVPDGENVQFIYRSTRGMQKYILELYLGWMNLVLLGAYAVQHLCHRYRIAARAPWYRPGQGRAQQPPADDP